MQMELLFRFWDEKTNTIWKPFSPMSKEMREIPNTKGLSIFVGKEDRAGIKLFSGDIIQSTTLNASKQAVEILGVVTYAPDAGCFMVDIPAAYLGTPTCLPLTCLGRASDDFLIVANIFQHPHILAGEIDG